MYLGDTGLLPGESLLWEGVPKRVPAVEKSDLIIVPGLLCIGFWVYMASRTGSSPLFVYVPPTVMVVLWIGQMVMRYFKRRSCSFVVTDRRVVVRRKGADLASRYLGDLGPPQLTEHADGTATITFGGGGLFTGFRSGTKSRDADSSLPELVGIDDARRVRDLIATAQHQAR
ncbi:hypothetical protein ACFQ05_04120 [Amycolatopsis umgeniensis]|uniref:PH domain-containing protein n=1 Tax=Amycolatopsis umgeniensis TaxID=336628 RepID=A0A841B0N3_9PSEU|nr:hypothetical protein [Amycolatopsis umgeniensis]MBB5852451.1 hypothetical protein [Amycolatopsis umgeniensis]